MGGSKAPAPPDYVGAAKETGASNLEAAIASGKINNPNVFNPYGSQSVSWTNDIPTLTQKLNWDQQYIHDQSTAAKQRLAATGNEMGESIRSNLTKDINLSGLPGTNDPRYVSGNKLTAPDDRTLDTSNKRRNDVVDAMMSRVNTDTAGQRDAANSSLIASGIRPGTAAYATAMTQIDRQYNDARNQALLAGGQEASRDFSMDQGSRQQQMADFNTKQGANIQNFEMDRGASAQNFAQDQAARKQAIAEMLTQRETQLNELSALQNGSQINNPFAGGLGYQPGANVQGTNFSQAAGQQGVAQQNAYNQNQATQNSNINAGAGLIGSLGSAAMYR